MILRLARLFGRRLPNEVTPGLTLAFTRGDSAFASAVAHSVKQDS